MSFHPSQPVDKVFRAAYDAALECVRPIAEAEGSTRGDWIKSQEFAFQIAMKTADSFAEAAVDNSERFFGGDGSGEQEPEEARPDALAPMRERKSLAERINAVLQSGRSPEFTAALRASKPEFKSLIDFTNDELEGILKTFETP